MKKAVKIFSLVLCIALIASAFAGCGADSGKKTNTGDNTLSYWAVMDGSSMASVSSYADLLFFQKMEERTGVKVDFIHPIEGSTGNEAFMTMLSASTLPDVVEYDWSKYEGGAQGAIDDGVIIELNDYLEEYAPNYYDYMEGEKGKANDYRYKYEATTADGNYYGFNCLNIGTARMFSGLYIRSDLLDKWGMDVPVTIDDWTAVFAKAKSEGIEDPFTSTKWAFTVNHMSINFHNAYNVGSSFYIGDDSEVVFGPFEKGYKEYITQMAEWVKAGYIDTGFVTNDDATVKGKIANGQSIVSIGGIGGHMGALIPAGQSVNPDFMLVACPFPVAKVGDKPVYLAVNGEAMPLANAITGSCANPEIAIKWCDFVYSEEGFILQTFGVEGDTFTYEEKDGEKHFVYTDKITKPENSGVTSMTEALYKYMLPANHPGLDQHPDYLNGYYPYQSQRDALNMYNGDLKSAKLHSLPTLEFTEDELQRKTDILEVAFDELEVAHSDMILGKISLDKYDEIMEQAKKDGYDELLDIYQAAYDRYIAKFE